MFRNEHGRSFLNDAVRGGRGRRVLNRTNKSLSICTAFIVHSLNMLRFDRREWRKQTFELSPVFKNMKGCLHMPKYP